MSKDQNSSPNTGSFLVSTRDFPWWARFATAVGIPTALSVGILFGGYLLLKHMLDEDLLKKVAESHAMLARHQKDSDDFSAAFSQIMRDQNTLLLSQTNVMRAMCVNLANNDDSRGRCFK